MRRAASYLFGFYWGQGIADDVPALTYYLVLSLAPFALGLAALEALLLEDVVRAQEVADQVNRYLPETLHSDITNLVVNTRDNSTLLLVLALAAMLWTTSGAIGVIERCESRMLECHRHNVVTGRIRNMVLGALVAATFAVAAAGAPVIGDALRRLDLRAGVPNGLLLASYTLGSIAVFAIIFRFAPRSWVGWRASLVGAVPAGIAVQAIPAIVGLYLSWAAGFAAVRVFLVIAVLLLGLYIMALVVLVGAGLAVVEERRRRRKRALATPLPGAPLVGDSHEARERAGEAPAR
jgi:membrane protein